MSEYEACAYGVKYQGEIIDVGKTFIDAKRLAEMVDGAEVVPLYREIKREEMNHD